MGYSFYRIDEMDRGYSVECKCHKRGCKERIDRGLGCLCYHCTQYFCGEHLTCAYSKDGNTEIEVECFAGESSQVCKKCADFIRKHEEDYIN
jgi:hypothetical protein